MSRSESLRRLIAFEIALTALQQQRNSETNKRKTLQKNEFIESFYGEMKRIFDQMIDVIPIHAFYRDIVDFDEISIRLKIISPRRKSSLKKKKFWKTKIKI